VSQDLSALLKRAQEMQGRMAELQRELAHRTVEASAGGGMVTAVATGELRIREIRIEPGLVSGGDAAMLQDLVAAAVNAALARAQQMIQEEMQKAAGGSLLSALGGSGGPTGSSGGLPGSGSGP
jgi:DNA-binding YbaB/EbfC family protein